ncbi:MAG: GPR endopeptidase [Oscillospiraceae bacterium]|jgi:spore protease|nr:GPR endopeptidase [Oscillospiraceae bacterium]
MNRTDLAIETSGVRRETATVCGLPLVRSTINAATAGTVGKTAGDYYTLHCPDRDIPRETAAMKRLLSRLIKKRGRILVCGLGNEQITPDSLGTRTARSVVATTHLSELPDFADMGMREVSVCLPGVLAQTGTESAEFIAMLVEKTKPVQVVVVDSLACGELSRVDKVIQVSTAGVSPGSGVGNSRLQLSRRTLGVDVLAIGVPTVLDLESVAQSDEIARIKPMVVGRDIDITVRHFAKVISSALNTTLNPNLTAGEIERLSIRI